MEKYLLPAIAVIIVIFLVLFIIWRNKLDRKELEEKLNQDYQKPHKHGNDVESTEEKTS
jgi:hypothetical protein